MRWWQHNRKALALLSAILSGIDVVLTLVESQSIGIANLLIVSTGQIRDLLLMILLQLNSARYFRKFLYGMTFMRKIFFIKIQKKINIV